jgi:hypothetical protein
MFLLSIMQIYCGHYGIMQHHLRSVAVEQGEVRGVLVLFHLIRRSPLLGQEG